MQAFCVCGSGRCDDIVENAKTIGDDEEDFRWCQSLNEIRVGQRIGERTEKATGELEHNGIGFGSDAVRPPDDYREFDDSALSTCCQMRGHGVP